MRPLSQYILLHLFDSLSTSISSINCHTLWEEVIPLITLCILSSYPSTVSLLCPYLFSNPICRGHNHACGYTVMTSLSHMRNSIWTKTLCMSVYARVCVCVYVVSMCVCVCECVDTVYFFVGVCVCLCVCVTYFLLSEQDQTLTLLAMSDQHDGDRLRISSYTYYSLVRFVLQGSDKPSMLSMLNNNVRDNNDISHTN